MKHNKHNYNFTLNIKKNGKWVSHTKTHKIGRILDRIRQEKTKLSDKMLYCLKVWYGKQLDNFGHLVDFDNEAECPTKKELLKTFRAFREVI